jgi:hypothetical protein
MLQTIDKLIRYQQFLIDTCYGKISTIHKEIDTLNQGHKMFLERVIHENTMIQSGNVPVSMTSSTYDKWVLNEKEQYKKRLTLLQEQLGALQAELKEYIIVMKRYEKAKEKKILILEEEELQKSRREG